MSPFDFPNIPSPTVPSGPTPYMPPPPQMVPSMQQQGPSRSLVSPFDIPNGRVQQLLANSTINSSSLGRPPPSPFDLFPGARTARSPFDVMLGACPACANPLRSQKSAALHGMTLAADAVRQCLHRGCLMQSSALSSHAGALVPDYILRINTVFLHGLC